MSDLSGNGAVTAMDAPHAPDFSATDRRQHENRVANVAFCCKTLQSPPSAPSVVPPAVDASPKSLSDLPADPIDDWDEPLSSAPDVYDAEDNYVPKVTDSLLRKVSTKQRMAIEILVSGDDLQEAARLAKVHRSTLYRWLNFDPDFQAELRAQQRVKYDLAISKAVAAVGTAMDHVMGAVFDRDMDACIRLLKGLGVLNGRRPNFEEPASPPPGISQ